MAKTSLLHPYVILFALLGATALLLALTVDVTLTDESGVRTELPETLGDTWRGDEVLFCHNRFCGRSWLAGDVDPGPDGLRHCPRNYRDEPCDGELRTLSIGEYEILPKDTVIFKKEYHRLDAPEREVNVSVVLSGEDRTSIHRPETCMQAQGNTIVSTPVIEVPLQGQAPLKVMVLNLNRTLPGGRQLPSYYAYWFSGKDRDTPHHHERALWMSMDRVFRGVAHRWAYIAVAGRRELDDFDTTHHEEIREVVGLLYPAIRVRGDER